MTSALRGCACRDIRQRYRQSGAGYDQISTGLNGSSHIILIVLGSYHDIHADDSALRQLFRPDDFLSDCPQIGLMGVFMIIRFPETDLGRGNNSDSALRRHCSRQSGKTDADAHPSLYHRNPGRQFPDC